MLLRGSLDPAAVLFSYADKFMHYLHQLLLMD